MLYSGCSKLCESFKAIRVFAFWDTQFKSIHQILGKTSTKQMQMHFAVYQNHLKFL